MRKKRKPDAEDGLPIVTYSRLPKDLDQPDDDGPHELRDAEPWLDGVEVPLVERRAQRDAEPPVRPERKPRARVAPDIRADADDQRAGFSETPSVAAADLFEPKRRRPRLLTYVAVIAAIALIGGFGVLAMTFHAATTVTAEAPAPLGPDPESQIADLRKQIDALANSAGPTSRETQSKIAELEARLADLEAARAPATADAAPTAADAADAPPKVRTIPTDGTPAVEAAPPAPRERPEKAEARATPPAAEKPAPVMELVAPVKSVSKAPFPSEGKSGGLKPANAKNGVPATDADFIANIEKALANAPADPAPASAAPAPAEPPVAPVALVPAGSLAPADEEPGSVAPTDAPVADALPTDIGPAVHAVPRGRLPTDAAPAGTAPITIAPQAAAPAVDPTAVDPPVSLDQAPDGAFDIRPQPGTPVPPEPIPHVQ